MCKDKKEFNRGINLMCEVENSIKNNPKLKKETKKLNDAYLILMKFAPVVGIALFLAFN